MFKGKSLEELLAEPFERLDIVAPAARVEPYLELCEKCTRGASRLHALFRGYTITSSLDRRFEGYGVSLALSRGYPPVHCGASPA